MKLKKIASLALAGVMAVSMLAGCAGKTGTTDDGTTVVVTGSDAAIDTFNEVQDTVKFASGTGLQNALELAAKSAASQVTNENAGATYASTYVTGVTGEKYGTIKNDATKDATALVVKCYLSTNDTWSEDAAVMKAATEMKNTVASYKDTTMAKNQTAGTKYYDYTYTGDVAVASATTATGTVIYYVAYTITQNVAEQTYTPSV